MLLSTMSFFVSYTPSVEHIQRKFGENFPYLKIEFYTKSFVTIDGDLFNSRLHRSTHLVNLISDRPLEVCVKGTPMQLESVFHLHFDVTVKIFRRTANGWIDITLDDKNSLFYHNRLGRDATNAIFDFELL
jgi:hypothetical protein